MCYLLNFPAWPMHIDVCCSIPLPQSFSLTHNLSHAPQAHAPIDRFFFKQSPSILTKYVNRTHWIQSPSISSVPIQWTEYWAVLCEKVPNLLSRCHTKRRLGGHGRARPSFGMTPTFQIFLGFFFEKSMSYQKKSVSYQMRPSFFWYDNNSGH